MGDELVNNSGGADMADVIYWIWMQHALGAGSMKTDKVIRQIGSPELLYQMNREQLAKCGIFAPGEIEKIKSKSLEGAKECLRLAEKHACTIITPDDSDYPFGFRNIECMPCVLYVKGDLTGLNEELLLTLVGTRESTGYGENTARRLAFDLAAAGCVVVSGLAAGIDYACHEGALAAHGRTIGLLACGLDVDYPASSHDLKQRILESGGALISEFPFGERAARYHFNIRNRLLSGISSGVVVVQAPERSGALNTARHALEQNRDVFAVPGEIFDVSMAGCNRLIRDGGKIVINVYSILEEYINRFPDKMDPKTIVAKIRLASGIKTVFPANIPRKIRHVSCDPGSGELPAAAHNSVCASAVKLSEQELLGMGVSVWAAAVYENLSIGPVDCDYLFAQTGLSAMETMAALTELELLELVNSLPGKRYTIR